MYYFFLGPLPLPVAPESMEIRIANRNETVTLINEGEVNILKSPGLTEVSFEFLLPHTKYPFANYSSGGFIGQSTIMGYLERLKKNKLPFQFIVTRMKGNYKMLFSTNIKVTLEEYAIREDAENGLDQIISVELKQYRPYSTKTIETDSNGNTTVKKERGSSSVLSVGY